MTNTAARTSKTASSPIPEVAAIRPARRGGVSRTLGRLSRLTLGAGGAALLLAPSAAIATQAGPWAAAEITAGWTAAEAAGAGLLVVAGLWAVVALARRPRWEVAPAASRDAAVPAEAPRSLALAERTVAGSATKSETKNPAPKRVDDVDPAAVRSTWSASASKKVARPEDAPATIPFPAAAVAERAEEEEEPSYRQEWPEEWGDEGNEPSVIRFEDVPKTIQVGERVIDLTEMDFDGGKEDMLKGLSKKERRTVRKALRTRERMLMRAA
ncbi:hypothetical protein [Alienimonas californiensis]|uniref:Uncharacterized protein n=1 Tax=Alienimonas californiensis TaxID=2527989 RepID=A0A517PA96_9PLAN|nr:hypothetical protein [Alienimonas californiensis]QDT16297.1 hypothetical protein CA12_23980 [Alienimonas californiensis]